MFKQISLLATTLLLTCSAMTAQDVEDFRFGLQISPSVSWMNTDDNRITNSGAALGLKLATQIEYAFTDMVSLASGIGFHFNTGGTMQSQYGGRFFVNSIAPGQPYNNIAEPAGPQVSLDYSIQYLEIPVSLKLRTDQNDDINYFLEAPIFTLGFRSNAKGGLSGGGISPAIEDLTIKEEINPVTLSWGFGGGVEYSTGNGPTLFGGLTFQRLFTDTTKDMDYDYLDRASINDEDPKATINSLTLRLGVLF